MLSMSKYWQHPLQIDANKSKQVISFASHSHAKHSLMTSVTIMFLQAIVAWDKQIYRLYHQHHPPRPAGRHLTDPLWYLRHGWWRWPLKPVLLKVEIELFHICVAKIAMATAYVHPFRQISFICTPKYAHWVRTASYLHPFRQCHAIQS